MLWLMYWLNYLDRNAITLARLNGFQDDLGLTSNQYSTAISILFVGYILGKFWLYELHVRHILTSYPYLCRANTEQHDYYTRQTFVVHGNLYDGLGGCKRAYRYRSQLHRHRTCTFLFGCGRGTILPRSAVSLEYLLHEKGDCDTHQHSLLWQHPRVVIRWTHCAWRLQTRWCPWY